jgi:SAM-dependent methyltransferase
VQQPSDLDAVRASHDRVADNYVALGMDELGAQPWLRAALAAFAEAVHGLGPVLDVGCGPGTVTAHLARLGLDVSGVDLSPRMVGHARRRHPDLRFSVASATELNLAPVSLGGVTRLDPGRTATCAMAECLLTRALAVAGGLRSDLASHGPRDRLPALSIDQL